jgi:hypothetical protein
VTVTIRPSGSIAAVFRSAVSEYSGAPAPRIAEAACGSRRGAAARASHQAQRGLAAPTSAGEEAA